MTVILFSDDRAFDDVDFYAPEDLKGTKLSGDYVNEFLRVIRFNPAWNFPVGNVKRTKPYRFALAAVDYKNREGEKAYVVVS